MAFVKDFEGRKQKFSHRHLTKNTLGGFCSRKDILLGKLTTRIKPSSWKRRVNLTASLSCIDEIAD